MPLIKYLYTCFACLLLVASSHAQSTEVTTTADTALSRVNTDSSSRLLIRQINISGNRTTKDYIILREIQFKPGDSVFIYQLNDVFQQARQQVYNTTLFNEVKVELKMISAFVIDVNVTVKERWYIWPSPQFQLIDRNFNEWWVKFHGDLSRVNYGLKFVHYNFSGRRDPLRIFILNGYTRNISFSYSQPYSNRKLTQGFSIGGGYSQNREMAYKTSYDNRILFFKQQDFVKENFYGNLGFSLQKGILSRQSFNLSYSYLNINDSILTNKYNPSYFNDSTNRKSIVDLTYRWQYSNVNNISYPLKGRTAAVNLFKRGLGLTGGINMLSIDVSYAKYFALKHDWYASFQLFGNIKLPFDQPYINQRGLGYSETVMRGLEYYVIDGVAYALAKNTFKKKILSFSIPFPFKSKSHTTIPFSFFAKTYGDVGFAYNKKQYQTNLNNRLLYSGGFGIDILTLYDVVIKFEYSFNQLGQNGLFLRSSSGL